MTPEIPSSLKEQFHELAAQFEFIDGLPRRLAEKRAAQTLNATPDESFNRVANSDHGLVVDVHKLRIHGTNYLRFSLSVMAYTSKPDAFPKRQLRSFIPAHFVGGGQEFFVGLHRYVAEPIDHDRQIRLRQVWHRD